MTAIVVHLIRNCFEASEPDRKTAEWPPHPARLFAALVDAADLRSEAHRAALEALASASPPTICCSAVSETAVPRSNFVVTNVREKSGSYGTLPLRSATGTRTWPRTILAAPEVWFEWPEEFSGSTTSALDEIAKRVGYFGRTTSPALVRVENGKSPAHLTRWRPLRDGVGKPMRGVGPHYLERLEQAFSSGMNAFEVPTSEIEYTAEPESDVAVHYGSGYLPTLAALKLGFDIDGRRAPELGALARRAFLHHLPDPLEQLPASLTGHANNGETKWTQVMFLPLLNVGHKDADGVVKGIAMALPENLDRSTRAIALEAWRKVTTLTIGSRGHVSLTAEVDRPIWALQSQRWTRSSHLWETVTPIVPERFLTSKSQKARYMVDACLVAGLPEPSVEILSYPTIVGGLRLAAAASARRESDTPRPNFHARLEFPSTVSGPLVLGSMRHYGLGLCIPMFKLEKNSPKDFEAGTGVVAS